MRGRTVLITGATSGIGRATALGLGKLGATVGVVARDAARGERTVAEIRAAGGEAQLFVADLASLESVRGLAAEALQRFGRLHVLVNNAGAWNSRRTTTADGFETTIGVNHLAHFLLTRLLLDRLKASAPARVVNVSSGAQMMGRIDLEDLQLERRFGGQRAYAQSKLANLMFTYELARRLGSSGVTVNALHPGLVRTNFGRDNVSRGMAFVMRLMDGMMLSPEQGAVTSLYLASSPEVEGVTGRYFQRCKAVPSSRRSYDTAVQARLWTLSARLVALAE